MKILWLTWKDRKHPQSGGAEVVNEELAQRLAADGHEVIILTARFKDAPRAETINGYRVIRVGNRYTVYWRAWRYYRKHLQTWADLVIDEVNTVPFFAKFYVHEKNLILSYMLCRQIWFYQLPIPLGYVGYILEPLYLRLLSDRYVITESESTKLDMIRAGFNQDKIHIVPIGIDIDPEVELTSMSDKFSEKTVLSLGTIRPMKRTIDQIKAFELAKNSIEGLRLIIAGDSDTAYGRAVLGYIRRSKYKDSIHYIGKVDKKTKIKLLKKSHLLLLTSVKEGWGLVATEAGSQGTPTVAYDVDGLRDSVVNGKSGLLTPEQPEELSKAIIMLMSDQEVYRNLRQNAWEMGRNHTFDKSYKIFRSVTGQFLDLGAQ